MGGIGWAACQRAISWSTSRRADRRSAASRRGSNGRISTPLARARRICARRLGAAATVRSQSRGSQTGCSPMRMAANGAPAVNRSSVPKKQARRPCAAAAVTNRCAAAQTTSGAAIGAAAATQARPVSMYATQASSAGPSNQ